MDRGPSTLHIRPATLEDIPSIQAVEINASAQFATVGMPEIARDPPLDQQTLSRFVERGHGLCVLTRKQLVGYMVVEALSRSLYIEQISVIRQKQRLGIGRLLLEEARVIARTHELAVLSLLTFRDVPWNMPFYVQCGFFELHSSKLTTELEKKRQDEIDRGFLPDKRVVMTKELG